MTGYYSKVGFSHYVWLFCEPMDCSLPGSSAHGISQARMLEWLAISFSRESSWPRDWTFTSCIEGGFFIAKPPGKPCWMWLVVCLFFKQICSPHWAVNSKGHRIFLSRTEHKLLLNGWMEEKMDIFNNSYARQLGLSGRKFLEDEVN